MLISSRETLCGGKPGGTLCGGTPGGTFARNPGERYGEEKQGGRFRGKFPTLLELKVASYRFLISCQVTPCEGRRGSDGLARPMS